MYNVKMLTGGLDQTREGIRKAATLANKPIDVLDARERAIGEVAHRIDLISRENQPSPGELIDSEVARRLRGLEETKCRLEKSKGKSKISQSFLGMKNAVKRHYNSPEVREVGDALMNAASRYRQIDHLENINNGLSDMIRR